MITLTETPKTRAQHVRKAIAILLDEHIIGGTLAGIKDWDQLVYKIADEVERVQATSPLPNEIYY